MAYVNILILLAFIGSIILWIFNKKIHSLITGKQLFWFAVITLVISGVIWSDISFGSYYDGRDSLIKTVNKKLADKKIIEEIFNSNANEEDKFNEYQKTAFSAISGIKIINLDNLSERLIKEAEFIGGGGETTINKEILETNIGKLQFEFDYSVEPKLIGALLRAYTLSLYDLWNKEISFIEWWKRYKRGNYKRSTNLWRPLFVVWFVGCFILFLWNKQSRQNKELSEFKTIHEKMYSDLTNEANQLKQPIQEFNFSWDYYIDKIFSTERHDLRNQLSDLSVLNLSEYEKKIADKVKNEYIEPLINIMLDNMKKIPEVVKYELIDTNISETINAITRREEAIPKSFLDGTSGRNFSFVLNNNFIAKNNEFCKVNPHRLGSIIFNVLANANKATQEQKDKLRQSKSEIKYIRRVWLDIDRYEENHIKVSIRDNAGGFPEGIKNKIYKEPVGSSKKNTNGTARYGEGTVYVSFFAKYMGIKIEAENCTTEDNLTGAKINLYIPIFTKGDMENGR